MPSPKKFAIVGAGVAGLLTATQLRAAGYDVTLFEKSGNVGGVWQSNYAGYALQVAKWHFKIPGYDWPNSVSHPKYPTGQECQTYIEAYAEHAGLLPFIRFNVEVKSLTPKPLTNGTADAGVEGAAGWTVDWADSAGKEHKEDFDYAVVATGLFNVPVHPKWAEGLVRSQPPPEGSGPWVVDVKDFTDENLAAGKKVVIIGGGKSAHDVALVTSSVAASTTLLARRGHWMAPQIVLGFLPLEFATYTRWSWALQPVWYAAGPIKKALHWIFSPVKAAAWGLFGFLFPLHTGTPSEIKPKHGLLEGIYDTIGMVDSKSLRKAFKSGRLAGKKGSVKSVESHKLELDDGTSLDADIVVLATGYRPIARSLLPTPELQLEAGYGDNSAGNNYEFQWLYRNVLPPQLSNIAFIGQLATFQHVLTAALQARWLVDVIQGKVKLPSRDVQLADVAKQRTFWEKKKFGFNRSNNYVWAQHGKYHDVLVKDVRGYTRAYSWWNPVGELFGYIKNELYAPLFPAHKLLPKGGPAALAAAKANGQANARKVNGKANGKTSGAQVAVKA